MRWAIFAAFLILTLPAVTMAAQVTLKWDASSTPADGYTVYQRVGNEAFNYTSPAWPKDGNKQTNKNTCTLSGLTEGLTYYFVARAHNGKDVSSDSNEVSYKVPVATSPTQSPTKEADDSQQVNDDDNPTANDNKDDIIQQRSDGIVSIEAEKFSDNVSVKSHTWKPVTPPSGYTGSGAMQAKPNNSKYNQTNNNEGYTSKSPRLDYKVNFIKSGTYYVWVRGMATIDKDATGKVSTDKNDSLHVGLDGVALASSDRIDGFGSNWSWSRRTRDKMVATIEVDNKGEHTINVWMREDGMIFDAILLTPSKDDDPNKEKVEDTSAPGTHSEDASDTDTSSENTSDTDTSSENASDTDTDDQDDNQPANDDNHPTASDDTNDIIIQQRSNGIVSIEAENYTTDATTVTHRWDLVMPSSSSEDNDPVKGCSGDGAVIAMANDPKKHTNNNTGYTTDSPRLDYKVNFTQTGTYYVWVRGKGEHKGRSLHVGLNGVALATADRIAYFPGNDWIWSGKTMDNQAAATIEIPEGGEGIHTINVWMREDGMMIDKIILTPSEDFDPNKEKVEDASAPDTNSENVSDDTATGSENVSDTDTPAAENLISIEAEAFKAPEGQEMVDGHYWKFMEEPSNDPTEAPSGDGAMQALPNDPDHHTNNNKNYTTKSPRLDYKVDFAQSGTYYIWVRGKAAMDENATGAEATDKNDSLHVGLDGVALASCDRLTGFSSSWGWSNETMDDVVATIEIKEPGKYTINVWMREDGMMFDKIVLTTSRDDVPTGLGPDEISR
jgi:predicted  nucleic acid-binding Zn-ribbon protein